MIFHKKPSFKTHNPYTLKTVIQSFTIHPYTYIKNLIHTDSVNINSNINLYRNIKNYFKNNKLNSETQLNLEKYLVDYSYALSSNDDKTISGIDTSFLNKKILNFLLPYENFLSDKITNFIDKKDIYKEDSIEAQLTLILSVLPRKHVLSIIFGRFLKIVSDERKNLSEVRNIGTNIILDISTFLTREYLYNLYLKNKTKGYSFKDWKDDNPNLIKSFEKPDINLKIGGIITDWMMESDLITPKIIYQDSGLSKIKKVFIFNVTNTINQFTVFEPNSESLNMFNNIIHLPMKLPMICKPKEYNKKNNGKYNLGGYLLNDEKFIEDIILPNHEFKESTRITDNLIYKVINNINSVGYKINTPLLEFIQNNTSYYKDDLLDSNHPYLGKDKLTKKQQKELVKYLSKLDLQQNILGIADAYSDIPEFYFVNRLDSRGRLYCVTEYLNYQGSELAKSLLLFSRASHVKKSDLTSLEYLKVFGANCYGNKIDKLSIEDKIKWVELNIDGIMNFSKGDLIKKAENRFLFSAFCFEYNRWVDFYNNTEEIYFNTYLPIQLDATCNGFQHLALLSLDSGLSKQLNLTESTRKEHPKDFYSYLIVLLIKEFEDKLMKIRELEKEKKLTEDELKLVNNKSSYERLIIFNIHRKLIKKVIMTIPYNATNYTLINNIKETLESSWNNDEEKSWYIDVLTKQKICFKDIEILVNEIREILKTNFPILTELIKYLEDIAVLCSKLELYIPWVLPNGLEVNQSYLTEKNILIKPFQYSKTRLSLKTYIDKYDKKIQVRAFMPNLIHSLDSCTLSLLINDYFNSDIKIKNIYTIHDCFAMPMNNVEYVIDLLKINYIKLYSDREYLKILDKQILNHIKLHYGENCYNNNTKIISIPNLNIYEKFPNINIVLGRDLDFDSLRKSQYILV